VLSPFRLLHRLGQIRPTARFILGWLLTITGSFSAQPAGGSEEPGGLDFLYGLDELFPSALLCFTENSVYAPRDDAQLGDANGVMSVKLRAPADNTVVTVTFTETALYATSSVVVNLPEANQIYHVAPLIRWNNERLAAQNQPWANFVVRADVTFHHEASDTQPTSVPRPSIRRS